MNTDSFTVTVVPNRCIHCKKDPQPITLDKERFEEWQNGRVIQECFPEMSVDDREMLITGIHPKCWDEMFSEDD